MSIAAPPAWVLALELDSGSWRCLVGLWSFADYGSTGPVHVWPRREQLAERTGQSANAVKKQLRKLAELGLVEVDAHGWRLAWGAERGPQGPGRVLQAPEQSGPIGSAPDTAGPKPGTTGPKKEPTGSGLINQSGPITTQQDQAGDARARHLAIVADQLRLKDADRLAKWQAVSAEQLAERESIAAGDARLAVTREHVDAVRGAGPEWAQQLERDTWARSLGEAIRELKLTPAQVADALAAWDRACELAGGPLAVEAAAGRGKAQPQRRAIWWASNRPWLAAQLSGGRVATRSGIGCDWADGDVPTLGGRSSW